MWHVACAMFPKQLTRHGAANVIVKPEITDEDLANATIRVNGRRVPLPIVRGGGGPEGPPAGDPQAGDPAPAPAPAADPPAGDPQAGDPADVTQLPEWAQKEIREARTDAGRYRNERNDARSEQQKYADQIKAINRALGIENDEPDSETLQKALSERETELRVLKVENAFTKAAKAHEADEELTLAVLSRNGVIAGLDPSAENFTAQLDAAVKSAVEANPKLRATQVATKSGSKFNGNGSGRSSDPIDLGSAIANAMT